MEKIDFVIIWVDGSDKKWLAEKQKYSPNKNTDSSSIRYRDWDNLKYLFRGIEKFAPWVNNVFFVTWGHLPKWLNTKNKKLKIINHKDYIPKEYLPTFSSHPIELNLHRISELSEHFVYFNDDMFLTNYVKPEDFFKKGKPCEQANINPVSPTGEDVVDYVLFNNTCVINKNFNKKNVLKNNLSKWINFKYGIDNLRTIACFGWSKFLGYKSSHLPSSLLKSTLTEIWNKEFDIMNETSKNKFRSKNDVSQYLITQWQLASNNFYPRSKKIGNFYKIGIDDNIYEDIKKMKYKMICLNDDKIAVDFELYKSKINESFEIILPEKSSYEK